MYTNLGLAQPEQNLVSQTKPSAGMDFSIMSNPTPLLLIPLSILVYFSFKNIPCILRATSDCTVITNPKIAESKPKQDVPKMYTCCKMEYFIIFKV